MVEYKYCGIQDLIDDASDSKEKTSYLKSLASKTETRTDKKTGEVIKDEKGKAKKFPPTFLQIKKGYYEKYYPEMIPVAKKAKKTFYDLINEL